MGFRNQATGLVALLLLSASPWAKENESQPDLSAFDWKKQKRPLVQIESDKRLKDTFNKKGDYNAARKSGKPILLYCHDWRTPFDRNSAAQAIETNCFAYWAKNAWRIDEDFINATSGYYRAQTSPDDRTWPPELTSQSRYGAVLLVLFSDGRKHLQIGSSSLLRKAELLKQLGDFVKLNQPVAAKLAKEPPLDWMHPDDKREAEEKAAEEKAAKKAAKEREEQKGALGGVLDKPKPQTQPGTGHAVAPPPEPPATKPGRGDEE